MLGTRVASGISMIVLLAGVLCPRRMVRTLVSFLVRLVLACAWRPRPSSWLTCCVRPAPRPSVNSVLGGVLALVIANWAPHVIAPIENAEAATTIAYDPAEPINALAWPFLTFVGVLMVCFVVQSVQFEKPGRTMATIAGTVLAVAYIGLLGSFMIQMRWLEGRLHGILPLLFLVACAKGADTGAYTFGRLAGRHKLWPSLSPNKTIEGAVGGMFCAVAASLAVTAAAQYLLASTSGAGASRSCLAC